MPSLSSVLTVEMALEKKSPTYDDLGSIIEKINVVQIFPNLPGEFSTSTFPYFLEYFSEL